MRSAFVIDVFARRIIGLTVSTRMNEALAESAFRTTLHTRVFEGNGGLGDAVHHNGKGSRRTAPSFTELLAAYDRRPRPVAPGIPMTTPWPNFVQWAVQDGACEEVWPLGMLRAAEPGDRPMGALVQRGTHKRTQWLQESRRSGKTMR